MAETQPTVFGSTTAPSTPSMIVDELPQKSLDTDYLDTDYLAKTPDKPCLIYATRPDILYHIDKYVTDPSHKTVLRKFFSKEYYKGLFPKTIVDKRRYWEIPALPDKDAVPFIYLRDVTTGIYTTAVIAGANIHSPQDLLKSINQSGEYYESGTVMNHTYLDYFTKLVTQSIQQYSMIIVLLLSVIIIYLYTYYVDHLNTQRRIYKYHV